MIEYKKGDLFDAPKGVVLLHACNAQGSWNSGVAKVFKEKFPGAFTHYEFFCKNTMHFNSDEPYVTFSKKTDTRSLVGTHLLIQEKDYKIACLFTSDKYGKYVDEPAQILQATRTSFEKLLEQLDDGEEVHMPKINSGLFRTPWDETEKCIESILHSSDKKIKCVVWTLE